MTSWKRGDPGAEESVSSVQWAFRGPSPQPLPAPVTAPQLRCRPLVDHLPWLLGVQRGNPRLAFKTFNTTGALSRPDCPESLHVSCSSYLSLVMHITCFLLLLSPVWYPNMSPASGSPP